MLRIKRDFAAINVIRSNKNTHILHSSKSKKVQAHKKFLHFYKPFLHKASWTSLDMNIITSLVSENLSVL